MVVEDLVFGFGFSVEVICRMRPGRVYYWHQRAHAYRKRMNPGGTPWQPL